VKFIAVGAAVAAGFVLSLALPAIAQTAVTGNCVITGAVYRAATNTELVGDTQPFTDIPGASVQFVQRSSGCVIVTFSAESFAPDAVSMLIRPLLDSTGRSVPLDVQFAANDPNLYTTRTAVFIFRNVAAGTHTIRMQFRASPPQRTEIGSYSLVVQHQR
jgi:hypothetical protein